MAQADLADPALIDDLRRRLGRALETCDLALTAAVEDLDQVRSWIESEQAPRWKRTLAKAEDDLQLARRRWQEAEAEADQARRGRGGGRQSADEERLAMQKARRRRDEAEARLAACRHWALRLRQDGEPLAHQCRGQRLGLEELGATAAARLTALAEAIARYQRPAGSTP